MTKDKPTSIVASSAIGVTILMLGQIFTKLLTFIVNQLLIRYISSYIFGITSFMELIVSCALFYSREGIRLTCQRLSSDDNRAKDDLKSDAGKIWVGTAEATVQSIVNLSMIPVMMGVPIMIILITQLPDITSYEYHHLSIVLLFASTIIELLSEPFYNLNQYNLNFTMRTRIESVSFITKCIAQFLVIKYINKYYPDTGYYILLFVISQFVYSSTILVSYLVNYYKSNRLQIRKIYSKDGTYYYFDRTSITYFTSLLLQLFFKYMLTEGDRFLLNYLCSTDEQGIFALITNYGSLILRLLFAPVEETLRLVLTKSFSSNNEITILDKKVQLISFLKNLLKFYIYLSLIIVIFAPFNSQFLLRSLIGDKWTTSTELLFSTFKLYWIYVPFLSVNGIMEATFYSITDDPKKIFDYSKVMVYCSFVYFVVLVLLIKYLQLSLIGLVLANMLNMTLRIVYCTRSLSNFLKIDNLSLIEVIKDNRYIYALISSIFIYSIHVNFIGSEVLHIREFVKSFILAGLLLLNFIFIERDLILAVIKPYLKGKKD